MLSACWSIIVVVWDWIVGFLNSNFSAALAGAFAGAVSADRFAARQADKGKLRDTIRDTNSAITLATLISNNALAMKSQHVLELFEEYTSEKKRFHDVKEARAKGGDDKFLLKANLSELPTLNVPIDTLWEIGFNRLSLDGLSMGLLVAIRDTVEALNRNIEKRNQLCNEFRTVAEADRVPLFLGLPRKDGTDATFGDCVTNIFDTTNSLAFFASRLSIALQERGGKLADRYQQQFGGDKIHINVAKFDTPQALRLMPPADEYSEFLGMFQTLEDAQSNSAARGWRASWFGWIKEFWT